MKIREWILPILVFSTFLLIGRWTGGQIEKSVKTASDQRVEDRLSASTQFTMPLFAEDSFAPMMPVSDLPLPTNQAAQPHPQKNILLIGVDDLAAAKPELRGIWLALYIPDMPRITLVPVYPAVVALEGDPLFYTDQDLAKAFKLSSSGAPDAEFLKYLEAKDLWWTKYAVLDGTAVAALLRFAGEINVEDERVQESPLIIAPDPTLDPSEALLYQLNIVQRACHARKTGFSPSQIAEFIESLEGHLATDISAVQVVDDLKSMLLFGGSLMCEFPSLVFVHRT